MPGDYLVSQQERLCRPFRFRRFKGRSMPQGHYDGDSLLPLPFDGVIILQRKQL